jgi:hypothetical protein
MTSASGLLISQTADAAIKNTYTASSTAGQTVFPVTNGYSTGLVDVFLNGTKLASSDYSDADGVNITLVTGSDAGDLLEFVKYSPALGVTNNALRQLTTFTSSEGQTVYSASYTPGLLDVYYNGSRLTPAEYTANNGTYITLATGSSAGDVIDMLVYSYQVGSFSGVGGAGVANQVAYWSTTSGITGSNAFTINGSTLAVTGSFVVITGSAAEFTVNPTGVNIGNVSTDTHTITGSVNMSGSFSTVGTITAQTLVVQTVTSSVDFVTGSTRFGSLLTNTHVFSGSVTMNPNGLFVSSSGNVGIGTTPNTTAGITELAIGSSNTNPLISGIRDGVSAFALNSDSAGTLLNERRNLDLRFSSNNTERMRITNAGSVGLGTTSPSGKLHVFGNTYARYGTDDRFAFYYDDNYYFGITNPSNDVRALKITAQAIDGVSTIQFFTGNNNERMRIRNDGVVQFTNNIWSIAASYVLRDSTNTTTGGLFTPRRNWLGSGTDISPTIAAETGYGIYTYTNGSTSPSGPYVSPGGTTWTNGSSDVRKKKNFETTQGLAEILQVEPIKYHFNEDDDNSKKRLGFKAQNILPLIPEMVSETGELAEDGSPYLTVTPDYILPVLVKALQEANAKITSLEEKLERNNIQ